MIIDDFGDAMRLDFNSDMLPAHLSAEAKARAWGEAMEALGIGIEASASSSGHFAAGFSCVRLGDVVIGTAKATSLKVIRTRQGVVQDGDDRFQLLVGLGPKPLYCKQARREALLKPGQAGLLDGGSPHTSGARLGGEAISIMLPRQRLATDIPHVEDHLSSSLDAASGALKLLCDYAVSLVHSCRVITPELARVAAVHISDLAVIGLGGTGDARSIAERRGLKAVRLNAVIEAITRRCEDASLSAGSVGAALGISARNVQHLLAEDGRTFSSELTNQRLERAWARLVDPLQSKRSVLDIAIASGFNDHSTFYRAFRARYGCTPSDARTLAGGAD